MVQLQIKELQEISVVAQKLQELRAERDKAKKEFDAEVQRLSVLRRQINEHKENLKSLYSKANMAIPK